MLLFSKIEKELARWITSRELRRNDNFTNLRFILGDSTECDREVCNIVRGNDEELHFCDVDPELKHGVGDPEPHRAHEPEIQRASLVAIEGIKEPTALINRLTAVCYFRSLFVYMLLE